MIRNNKVISALLSMTIVSGMVTPAYATEGVIYQNEDEDGKARYTKDFKIYKYEKNDIVELKRMIKKSFDNNTYNKQVF